MADDPWIECHFFVPLVKNSDQKPHSPTAWKLLQNVLRKRFAGLSGPEGIYVKLRPIPGEYTSKAGEPVGDESYRYIVAVEKNRIDELRELMKKIGNTFDQEAIYFSVRGEVTCIYPSEADGCLADE